MLRFHACLFRVPSGKAQYALIALLSHAWADTAHPVFTPLSCVQDLIFKRIFFTEFTPVSVVCVLGDKLQWLWQLWLFQKWPASRAAFSARAWRTSALGGSSLRCCWAERGTRGISGSFSLHSVPSCSISSRVILEGDADQSVHCCYTWTHKNGI